tara:strand:+ start:158 stop:634 length:477 start_codon:yes stop_codon:yes gene_type:complete
MSNKVLIDTKKEELINFYNNLLFENNHGCWILNINGFQSGHKLISKINNKELPNKVYSHFYYPPIHFNDIENIKYYIDHKETSRFTNKLEFYKRINIPKSYSIFIKIKNIDSYICYDYYFSKAKYHDPRISIDTENIEKNKKDIEFKIYVLKHLNSKL